MLTQEETRQLFIKYNKGVQRPGKKGYWYRCASCGKWCGRPGVMAHNEKELKKIQKMIPDNEKMEVDHILPWSKGGSDALWNLQPLCKPCNRAKGNMMDSKDTLKAAYNTMTNGGLVAVASNLIRKDLRNNQYLKSSGVTKRR